MSSVVVTWKGRCESADGQARLLAELGDLASLHVARWREPPQRPAISDMLASQRRAGLPQEPDLRPWDETVEGNILVCGDVAPDPEIFAAAIGANPTPLEVVRPPRHSFAHVRLERLRLKGVEFRFFDPRELYPGEDRFSFVFLQSDEFPFLDGLIASARGPQWCARIAAEGLTGADWYVECPSLHLRGFLEEWAVLLLSWIKHFHVPDLLFNHDGVLEGHERRRRIFEDLERSLGRDGARANVLKFLRIDFQAKSRTFAAELAAMRARK
ncbi:MAG: hypothetical protein AB7R90_06040 [Reyranellaceae bacterium]